MLKPIQKTIAIVIVVSFLGSSIQPPAYAQVDPMPWMPIPGSRVSLSSALAPAYLKGIVVYPEDPFKFDFIIYKGDKSLTYAQKKEEYTKLTKYFLASLAIPDDDQWVNLSPYEKDRIIKDDFGKTEMGRDLLAQDYLLKQITASLIYPEGKTGREFWNKIYTQVQKQFGTTNIPIDTFNKVWIVPDNAEVFEKGPMAYCDKSHLKVMLEQDYLALSKHVSLNPQKIASLPTVARSSYRTLAIARNDTVSALGSQILREIVIPELTKEVNEGKNFVSLRQVFSGVILAAWYKKVLKESFVGKVYMNKSHLKGVDQDPRNNQIIYQRYLRAFKKGVFNFIKEDMDAYSHEAIPRKYFSGGTQMNFVMGTFHHGPATTAQLAHAALASSQEDVVSVTADEVKNTSDAAMSIDDISDQELSELTRQLFKNYAASMDLEFGGIPTPEKFIKALKWLAAYESPLFDKTKQILYKKAIVRALRTPNSKVAENLPELYTQIQRLRRVHDLGGRLDVFEDGVWDIMMEFITEEDSIQLYEPQIIRMKDMPKSSLFPEADYEQWIRTVIAVGDVSELGDIFTIEADLLSEEHISEPLYTATDLLFAFFQALPLEQQRDVAGKIVKRLNDPANVELISSTDYDLLIDALPRKVGMLTNDRVLEHLYKQMVEDHFLYYSDYGEPGEDGDMQANPLFDFMLYNPSPSALKITIKTWHGQGAITDIELNKFNWLTAMVPKESGNTRDRRRQIHRYLIRLIQYRHMRDNKSIADFMSRILRAVDHRLFDRENINELLNFMLAFTNLGVGVQRHIVQKAEALISAWQYEAQGEKPRPPKEFLAPTHFKLLTDFMTQEVIQGMIDRLETFDAQQKKDLYAHIRKYPAAWNRLGFLDTLSSYIAFQNPEGKIQTEKLLKQLMRSKVQGDRFIFKERYKGMDFDRGTINRWRQSVSIDLPIPANFDDARKLSYEGIRQDLLLHAGIQSTGDWSRDKQQLQQHFSSLNFAGLDDEQQIQAREELITLINVLEEVVLQFNGGHEITSDQVQRWKKRLMPKGEIEPPFWYRQNISMREMIVNLDQIGQIKPLDIAEIQRITFNVQDDPQVFVRSFMEPFPTCQRCIEPTQYNKEGQPINRARQGQFLVASIRIEYKDGHSEIVTRAQLELAKGKPQQSLHKRLLESILEMDSSSQAGINRRDGAVLLVERLYSGLFPKQVIQNEIFKWASANGSFLDYVVFADPFNGEQFLTHRIIDLEFLESDGTIYRDTYKSPGAYNALRVDKGELKESVVPDRAMGSASKNLGGIDFNAVHWRLQIKRDERGGAITVGSTRHGSIK